MKKQHSQEFLIARFAGNKCTEKAPITRDSRVINSAPKNAVLKLANNTRLTSSVTNGGAK